MIAQARDALPAIIVHPIIIEIKVQNGSPATQICNATTIMQSEPTFTALSIQTGLHLDLTTDAFPTRVCGWNGGGLALPEGDTHYGMVTAGDTVLRSGSGTYRLQAGMFFVAPGEAAVD